MSSENNSKKDLDFEINLLPVLSVMSICICFLLTTTVWSRMGFLSVNQAIGDEIPSSGQNPDSIIFKIQANGFYVMQWKRGTDSSVAAEKKVPSKPNGKWSIDLINKEIDNFVNASKAKMVVVMPEAGIKYGQTISLLDHLKSLSVSVGLAPAIKPLELNSGRNRI